MTKRVPVMFAAGLVALGVLLVGSWSLFWGAAPIPMQLTSYQGAPCVAGEILVKFKPGLDQAGIPHILRASRAQDLETLEGIGVHRLGLAPGTDLSAALADLRRDPAVDFAEPDYRLHLASTIPNDPYFSFQWALRNTGQPLAPPSFKIPSGKPGADIKASEAWDLVPSGAPTIVGVVDTGVDLTHPDLVDHILSPGIDFPNNDFSAQDDHGHGTHVAGIIAAAVNNSLGVAGVNNAARVIPAKVFNRNAVGLTSWVANGIVWAAANGARVINMSLGGRDVVVNQTLELAIKFAFDRNVVLVAAAGNDGTAGVWYPAAYEDYVLAVAATDQNDRYVGLSMTDGTFGSNFGPEVDVAAPGLDILSTWGIGLYQRGHPGFPGYVYNWGTSMSTAFVSGLASLIISSQPDLTNRQVMDVIRLSADDVNADILPGRDDYLGYGRINALKAIQLAAVIDRLGQGFIRLSR
jgi:thermitase